jgi:hypothetical protein
MDSLTIVRADLFEQYVDWWRGAFSDVSAWVINQLAHSPEISWSDAFHFVNDYLLLPLVIFIGLAILLKQTLSG